VILHVRRVGFRVGDHKAVARNQGNSAPGSLAQFVHAGAVDAEQGQHAPFVGHLDGQLIDVSALSDF
jgi:hypothetical protein